MNPLLYLVVALALALATIIATALAHRHRVVWTNRVPAVAAALYTALGFAAAGLAPNWPAAYLGAGIANLLSACCLISMAVVTSHVKRESSIDRTVVAVIATLVFGIMLTVAGAGGWLFGLGVR